MDKEEAKRIAIEYVKEESVKEFRRLKAENRFTWAEFERIMNEAQVNGLCKYLELINEKPE